MNKIRQANPDDLDALYSITVKTGNQGEDARHLYSDEKMLGHIYAAPYLEFSPDLAFVVERDQEVLGFCVGTQDTHKFDAQLEQSWWPPLRRKYKKPDENTRSPWSADDHGRQFIHHPEITPAQVVARFPAHLHINLLPLLQGHGVGALLLGCWMEKAIQLNVSAVHIGASAMNERAILFWEKQGFERLALDGDPANPETVWMGRKLP